MGTTQHAGLVSSCVRCSFVFDFGRPAWTWPPIDGIVKGMAEPGSITINVLHLNLEDWPEVIAALERLFVSVWDRSPPAGRCGDTPDHFDAILLAMVLAQDMATKL